MILYRHHTMPYIGFVSFGLPKQRPRYQAHGLTPKTDPPFNKDFESLGGPGFVVNTVVSTPAAMITYYNHTHPPFNSSYNYIPMG